MFAMTRRIVWICIMMLCGTMAKKKSGVVINYTSGVEVCKDEDSKNFMETNDLQPVRINETTSKLEGGFSFKKEINGLVKQSIVIERVSTSGSSEIIATHTIKDVCLEFKRRNEETPYSTYMRTINVPNCPIPPAQYRIDNMVADMKMLPTDLIFPGVYRLTFTFSSYEIVGKGLFQSTKDTRLGCLSFECTVESI